MDGHRSIIKTGLGMLLVSLTISGCGFQEKLVWLDDRSGEMLEIIEGDGVFEVSTSSVAAPEPPVPITDAREITKEVRSRIDQWLENNNFNRYGDPAGTNYEKGTPLIDSETGKNIERMDYVLRKIPDIWERMNGSR